MPDTYRFLQALLQRMKVTDPMEALREFQLGPEAGTLDAHTANVLETLEALLIFRIEEGDDPEHAEREMGMAAIVMLALRDVSAAHEQSDSLTLDQDAIARGLLESVYRDTDW
jgi:hypothetical protein